MMQRRKRTEHTELYFGCKNRKQKKMARSKVTSGSDLPSMLETGAIIAKKVSVFNTTRMVTNMKVCGP